MAGMAVGRSGGDARSLRPNIALYLRNNGRFVSSNDFSRFSIDCDWSIGGAGSIDAKSLQLSAYPEVTVKWKYLSRNFSTLRSSEFSHSILATEISQVSLTTSTSSLASLNRLR